MNGETTLQYKISPEYRTILADFALAVLLATPTADRLILTFTRTDVVPIGEPVTRGEGGRINIMPGTTPETETQKTVEVAIDLKPDLAMGIANSIIISLSNLSLERKRLYGIPEKLEAIRLLTPGYPPQ